MKPIKTTEIVTAVYEIKCGAIRDDYIAISNYGQVQERCKGVWMRDLNFTKPDRDYFRCVCK